MILCTCGVIGVAVVTVVCAAAVFGCYYGEYAVCAGSTRTS